MKKIQKHYAVVIFVSALIVVAASIVAITKLNHTDTAPAAKPSVEAATRSQFRFTGASGWWQGATNKTSMALFHDTDGCFTSAEYKPGTVDVAAEIRKIRSELTAQGYTVASGPTQSLPLQTATETKQYDLYQSTVTTPEGARMVQGGQEFGYVQLAGGYIKVMGYCDTSNQLAATIPALRAIKFEAATN